MVNMKYMNIMYVQCNRQCHVVFLCHYMRITEIIQTKTILMYSIQRQKPIYTQSTDAIKLECNEKCLTKKKKISPYLFQIFQSGWVLLQKILEDIFLKNIYVFKYTMYQYKPNKSHKMLANQQTGRWICLILEEENNKVIIQFPSLICVHIVIMINVSFHI